MWVGVAAFLLFGIFGAMPTKALAQDQAYHFEKYDSQITVNVDGSLDITEMIVYSFDSGTFRRAIRTWDLDKLGDITDIKVVETTSGFPVAYERTAFDPDDSTSGVARTFGIERSSTELRLRWIYGPTSNTTRSFNVSYHVEGAIRVYDNLYRLDWYAVPPRLLASISGSTVEAIFPEGSDTTGWETASVPSSARTTKQGNTITWSATSGFDEGFEVGADIPKSVLEATKPGWQDQFDSENPNAVLSGQTNSGGSAPSGPRSLIDLGILLLSIVVLVGGTLWRLASWYMTGRDKEVKLPIDYLAEPPSNLPPGLVGTLLDEKADIRDVIATIADLGRQGKLSIAEGMKSGVKDYQYTLINNQVQNPFEGMVLNAVFGGGGPGQQVKLSEFKADFKGKLPAIYTEMYKALLDLNYFPKSPEEVRNRAGGGCCAFTAFGSIALFLGLFLGSVISPMLTVLGIAIGIVGAVYIFSADAMPRKTDFGSEEAAKWRAFKRYLQNLQSYTNVQAAADKMQQYLPYAVAMGIESDFIKQFNSVPAAMPQWYLPYGLDPLAIDLLIRGGVGAVTTPMGNMGGATAGAMPNLDPGAAMQGMSDSLGGAMQGLSDSFSGMVNAASGVFSGENTGKAAGAVASGVSGAGGEVAGKVASSVGGLLVSVAISAIFGGGGGGGGSAGAD